MLKNKKQAFTLVELIVVITILAILWTIAFISLQWYARDARDSIRLSDIKSISSTLEYYKLENSSYPLTTNGTEITYKWAEVWTQWIFWDLTHGKVWKISKVPLDPQTKKEYTYSLLNNKSKYSLAWVLEGSSLVFEKWLINQSYANKTTMNAIVKWNYYWVVLNVNTWWIDYVLAIPSIITSSTWTSLEEIIINKQLVFNNYQNLPTNYNGTDYDANWWFDFKPNTLEIWSWSIEELSLNQSERLSLLKNIQKSYWQTVLDINKNILNILKVSVNEENPSEKVKQLSENIFKNDLKINIQKSKNEWEELPDDIRQIFATWSFYTKHWETNNCNPDLMTVVEVDPGIDPFSWINHIPANSIYKLKDGDYILPAPLYDMWNCIWIIWNKNTKIYNSIQTYPLSINEENLIILNLIIDWTNNWLWWIHEENYISISFNPSNSTIANLESFNSTYWLLTNSTSAHNNYYYNLDLHNNSSYWLHIFWHDNIIDNITTYNNNYWIRLEHALNNTLTNITTYDNNTWLLINFDSNNNIVKNLNWFNNVKWVSLSSSWNVLNNIHLFNNEYYWIETYVGFYNSINNFISYNNKTNWLTFNNSDFNIINNVILYNNMENGLYLVSSVDNNILSNILSFNNELYWISSNSSNSLDNNYYWKNNIFNNTLWNVYIWYSSLTSWVSVDQVVQNLGLWDWIIDESWDFSKEDTVIPSISWWDYNLKWDQCLVLSGCINEVLTERFDWTETYIFGENIPNQTKPVIYNSWTLEFEYYWTEFDDYNTYMKIWEF